MIFDGIRTNFNDSGSYQILSPSWWVVDVLLPGSNCEHSRILETDSRGIETEPGSLETELREHRIHGTLGHRITDDASQLGGPSQGGAGG